MHETEKHAVLGKALRDLDVYELTLRAMIEHQFTREATVVRCLLVEQLIGGLAGNRAERGATPRLPGLRMRSAGRAASLVDRAIFA